MIAIRPAALLGAVSAGVLAVVVAGCAAGRPVPYRATTASCYAFSVNALRQRVTVTEMPQACAGLSHEQINLAVIRAVREVVGPQRKVAGRRLAHRELAYLAYLIRAAPVPAPAPVAAPPAAPSSRLPLRLAALGVWVVTILAGAWLLAGWLTHGGSLRRGPRTSGVSPPVIAGHFTLALAGLGIWIAFAVTGVTALAWVAVVVILAIVGLGMATLAGGLPGARATAGPSGPASGGPAGDVPGIDEPGDLGRPATVQTAAAGAPARGGPPLVLIAVHGALAATTLLLVVLAAIGAG